MLTQHANNIYVTLYYGQFIDCFLASPAVLYFLCVCYKWQEDISWSICYLWSAIMKLEFFEQVWLKISNIKFHKICLVVAEWFHVDRQTEMMQLTVAFVVVVQVCLKWKSVTSRPFSVIAEVPHVMSYTCSYWTAK